MLEGRSGVVGIVIDSVYYWNIIGFFDLSRFYGFLDYLGESGL